MKKLLSTLLALVLVLSMATVAFAVEKNTAPTFSKTYKITNAGTSNPEETFTFSFTADHVTDSNKNLTVANMPPIADSTITFSAGTATTDGLVQNVDVALANVKWPGVGIYYYKVNEVAGSTAGVIYDSTEAWLKVTVAYDDDASEYYLAFVTLNLTETNEDGTTKNKTGGFTNEYQAGSLSISKTVSGAMGDKNAYFDVKVKLTGEAGKTYAPSYTVSGGTNTENPSTIAIGTETTFKLKHGDTITIANLPYGVTYTVEEEDYTSEANGGYDKATYVFSDDTNKKIDSAEGTVSITNNKGANIDTGIALDSAPYFLMLAVACVGMFLLLSKKRAAREY